MKGDGEGREQRQQVRGALWKPGREGEEAVATGVCVLGVSVVEGRDLIPFLGERNREK